MDKYRINYVFSEDKDINDIFIKVLDIQLKKYIRIICKNKEFEVPSSHIYLSFERGRNC